MRYGYQCEECEEAVWLATTRPELQWLRSRRHVVREVRRHLSAGLDGWMEEGSPSWTTTTATASIVVEGARR